jgi:hypothetical protein
MPYATQYITNDMRLSIYVLLDIEQSGDEEGRRAGRESARKGGEPGENQPGRAASRERISPPPRGKENEAT